MKIFIKAALFVFIAGMGLSSCEKESNTESTYEGYIHKEGEDTDGPIFVGLTTINQGSPVYPGLVELYSTGTGTPLDSAETNSEGRFSFNLEDAGYYFIKVYQNNSCLGNSGSVHVEDSTYFEFNM